MSSRDDVQEAPACSRTTPPSRELRVELCAARYSAEDRTIKLEKKEQIKERLGRSPDLADAVVMAFWDDRRAELAELYRRPLQMRVHGW